MYSLPGESYQEIVYITELILNGNKSCDDVSAPGLCYHFNSFLCE